MGMDALQMIEAFMLDFSKPCGDQRNGGSQWQWKIVSNFGREGGGIILVGKGGGIILEF